MNKNNFLNSIIETSIDTTDQQSTLEKICNTRGGEKSKWKEYERTMHEIIITKYNPLPLKYESTINFYYDFWHKVRKEILDDNIRRIKIIHKKHLKELLWCKKEREDNRQNNKRCKLKNILLNNKFKGSEGHHIDKKYIIYIPKKLHHSIYHNIWTGQGMKEINDLAWSSFKEKHKML